MVLMALGFINFNSSQFWLSLYLQNILNLRPLTIALYLIPQAISGILVNILAAYILSRVDNRILLSVGGIAYCVSAALLAAMSPESSYWAFIFPALIISVVGADLQYNVANMYVLGSLPKDFQSTAGGVFNTVLQLANGVGLGISTAVWNGVSGPTGEVDSGQGSESDRANMIKGYRATFWFLCGIAGFGARISERLSECDMSST